MCLEESGEGESGLLTLAIGDCLGFNVRIPTTFVEQTRNFAPHRRTIDTGKRVRMSLYS